MTRNCKLLGMTRNCKLFGMARNCKLLGMARGRKLLATSLFPLSFRTSYSRVIPNVVRNPQLGIRRETVQNSRRFLVAALLGMTRNCKLLGMTRDCKLLGMTMGLNLFGMARGRKLLATTGRSDLRNVPFPAVIPNVLLPCHSERSEESAVGNTAGDGAKLEEIPRRCAPRNDKELQALRNGKGSQAPRNDRKE
jgi:hypothetical protein